MTGTFFHSIDTKGRLSLPPKLRDVLGTTFWLTRGMTGTFLSVYPQAAWESYKAQFEQLPGAEGEKLCRWLYSGSSEVTQDKQGRVLIPPQLRRFAQLEKDVVVLGVGKKAEIWNVDNWTAEEEAFDPSQSGLLDTLYL